MITIKIDTKESAKLLSFMENNQRLIDSAINKALRKVGDRAQQDARRFAPVKRGQLRRSIQKRMGHRFIIIGTDLKYAPVHEFGATITPKKAKTLAFKVNGKWVFAKRVVIPKYKGRGYFNPAFQEARKFAKQVFKTEIQAVIK